MKTLASRAVQNNFGGIADIVKSGEPVTVTQHGRPTLMILPYAQGQEALRLLAAQHGNGDLAFPALSQEGGTYIARGLPAKVYESGRETRVVIIEFPDVDTAVAAHDSPAYQEALAALDGGAVRDMRIIPGL